MKENREKDNKTNTQSSIKYYQWKDQYFPIVCIVCLCGPKKLQIYIVTPSDGLSLNWDSTSSPRTILLNFFPTLMLVGCGMEEGKGWGVDPDDHWVYYHYDFILRVWHLVLHQSNRPILIFTEKSTDLYQFCSSILPIDDSFRNLATWLTLQSGGFGRVEGVGRSKIFVLKNWVAGHSAITWNENSSSSKQSLQE